MEGRGVKEKNGFTPSVKDGGAPSVTVAFRNNSGTQEANSDTRTGSVTKSDGIAAATNVVSPLCLTRLWQRKTKFFGGNNWFRIRVAYPVVANYFRNTWGKYGLVRSIFSSSTGLFSFQFSSMDGLDAMHENGPWFIHNNPLILKKWHPDENLLKEDVSVVPVEVKLHGVPVTTFSEDGLSAIATKLGTPLMLDSYTYDMFIQPWGRSRYVRAMIKLCVDVEWKDNIMAVMLKVTGKGSPSTAPVIEKIDKIKKLVIDEKVTLVDDEGKPLEKVDYSGYYDSEDEVTPVNNEMASFLAKKDGYCTQSLLQQWRESYENCDYEYDPYDDDMYEGQDIPDKLQAIDNLDIKVRGRKKK
nr:hypothetical protein [Tanacetum cinerariifolium]